ncbi:MAG: hypothetical protein IJD91_09530 [Clostridia bacterium]|nr:hypothetical protein [Clostridia bacterium]
MKSRKVVALLLVMAAVLACVYVAIFITKSNNFKSTNNNYDSQESDFSDKDKKQPKKEESSVGSIIILKPDVDDAAAIKEEDMDTAEAVIRTRLDTEGFAEATVSREGNTGFRIEIPDCDDPINIASTLCTTAKLEFFDADGYAIMDGSRENIKGATALYGPVNETGKKTHYVQMSFTKKGQEEFYKATQIALVAKEGKNIISIALDEVIQASPTVTEAIDSDTCIITGNYDKESARLLATLINSGSLPFTLKVEKYYTINP